VRVTREQTAPPRAVAAALPLLGVLVLAAVGALTVAAHDRPRIWTLGDDAVIGNGLGSALAGLTILAGAAVVLRRPEHVRLGWALAGCGLFWSVDGLAESYISLGLVSDGALPAMTLAVWMLLRFNSFLPLTIVLLALLFPGGRFLPGRWRVASWGSVVVLSLSSGLWLVTPYLEDDVRGLPPGVDTDPTTLHALGDAGPVLAGVVQSLALAVLLVPVGVVVTRYRRSSGTLRARMRWLLWGVLATMLVILGSALLDVDAVDPAFFFLAVVLVPVSMTVAVVDPRLVDIEDLLARTLVYGGLSVLLVLADLAVLAALTELAGDALPQGRVVVVLLLVSVLVYGPLRLRLWSVVRRSLLGSRDDPYDVVAGLASSLEAADEGPAQLAAVARAVAEAFGIGYVRVEVDRGAERVVATHGTAPAETRTLPITYRDAEVGVLVLPARGLRSRLSRRDERLLGDLVRQAATAARTSRLADELQDNRERLVVAREEERRRIRRDLHDGLGPALSGVVFQLESARLLVDADPESAKQQLEATSRHVQDVVADVRRLVHDLRPPALDDRGLVGALRQQAERLVPGAVVEAAELGALPAAVEVAAYRIASEALTNVARHAGATRCTVRLDAADGVLLVEVVDDGRGVDTAAQAGVGLVGLRERAAELGGRSEVTCPTEGGTVVRAWLPLRRNHE
jgi:signal transduction histidine kinase